MSFHKDLVGLDLHGSRAFYGTGSPINARTPAILGELFLQTDANPRRLWVAYGLNNTDWQEVTAAVVATGKRTYQRFFTEVTVDTTTTSNVFVDLLTTNVTISNAGRALLLYFTASADNTNSNRDISFRITLNGSPVRGANIRPVSAGSPESCALIVATAELAPGSYTAAVQWRTSANTARIQPVTNAENEHASLLVEEIEI